MIWVEPWLIQCIVLSLGLVRVLGDVLGSRMFYRPVLDLVPILALVMLAMINKPWLVETCYYPRQY